MYYRTYMLWQKNCYARKHQTNSDQDHDLVYVTSWLKAINRDESCGYITGKFVWQPVSWCQLPTIDHCSRTFICVASMFLCYIQSQRNEQGQCYWQSRKIDTITSRESPKDVFLFWRYSTLAKSHIKN